MHVALEELVELRADAGGGAVPASRLVDLLLDLRNDDAPPPLIARIDDDLRIFGRRRMATSGDVDAVVMHVVSALDHGDAGPRKRLRR